MKYNFNLSFHAQEQFKKRFPELNINNELKDLVLLSGQYGKSKAYLSCSNAVFIVDENIVVTVMSQQMYLGNLAARTDISLDNTTHTYKGVGYHHRVSDTESYSDKNTKQVAFETEQRRIKAEHIKKITPILQAIIQEHIIKYPLGYNSAKIRDEELKELGYSCNDRKLYKELYSQEFYARVKV